MIKTATVKIWDETVGAVLWDETTGIASFEYESSFVNKGWMLSPLIMPNQAGRVFSFPDLKDTKTFSGLPGLVADSLPDDYGNQMIDNWLATHGRAPGSMNPVEKLCFIGSRGMGALEYELPILKPSKSTFKVEVDSLFKAAQEILAKREDFETNLSKDDEKAVNDIIKISTSAGGMRAKAIIAYNDKTGEVRSGQTKAPKGFEHWLIKLDGANEKSIGEPKGWGRVEYAYYKMAKDCGINMTASQLFEENGRAHFMTKRFDREDGDIKHHVQTLCAMQHWDYNQVGVFSYEQLFQTMRQLGLTYPEAEEMFRRMTFNVLALNRDDHTKNFAFMLKQVGKWQLAPAYDVCHAFVKKHQWLNDHALTINGKREGFVKADLMKIAASMNIKKAEGIIENIVSVVGSWQSYAEEARVPIKLQDQITINLNENLKPWQ